MIMSVTVPEGTIELVANSPEEIRLSRDLASLEAQLQNAHRVHDRSEDFIAMIDWSAMTIDDREDLHNHTECLNWHIYELHHQIDETSDRLWAAYFRNPLNC